MNILLNFFPVSSGGGQQVASNFMKIIAANNHNHNWFFFVGENSELHILAKKLFDEESVIALKYSYIGRFTTVPKIRSFVRDKSIDIIYNYAPTLSVPGVPQVVRSVYSNLYFPEIPFWKSYPYMVRIKKAIIDHFRLKGTLNADGLIFENESMLSRAVDLFSYPKDKVVYIEPSVTSFDESNINKTYQYINDIDCFKILYLSSWHLNKNIHLLPEVASILSRTHANFKFILSLDPNNLAVQNYLINKITELKVEDHFELIGKVQAVDVHQVVKSSSCMILLSKLECFSSNVVEAFYFHKPLLIADEPWAHSACHESALYVNRDDMNDISLKISKLMTDELLYRDLISKGDEMLKRFNTPEEKVMKQVRFLEYINKNYEKRN